MANLPWGACAVRLQLRVRMFFCRHAACSRQMFTDRLPAVAAPWARWTPRLVERLRALGVALGGTAGTRLTPRFGLPASRDTPVPLVRRLPLSVGPPLCAIGIDDWAHRKRQRYSTISVDLERQQPHMPQPLAKSYRNYTDTSITFSSQREFSLFSLRAIS